MPKDNMSVREAGSAIMDAGLGDDVIQAREGQITERRGRQREDADDADTGRRSRRREDDDAPRGKKKSRREVEEVEEDEYDYDEDDDADSSNRETGELEEGDEDDEGERDEADEGDEDADPDADAEEGDDAEDDDDLHTVKVDGKEFKVTTAELKAGYQRNKDYHQKTAALASKHRELQGGHGKAAEMYARKLQHLGAIYGGIRHILVGDIDSQEMQQLLASDPQKWQIQRTLMQDRIGKVDQVLHGLNQEHERHVGEFTNTRNANLQQVIDQERALVVQSIPDWDTKGKKRLGSYLNRRGFTNAELADVTDHRMLIIADNARKWEEYQASKKKPFKRTSKPAPKSVKTGQGQIKRGSAVKRKTESAFRQDAAKARKSGDTRDAGKAISHLL